MEDVIGAMITRTVHDFFRLDSSSQAKLKLSHNDRQCRSKGRVRVPLRFFLSKK